MTNQYGGVKTDKKCIDPNCNGNIWEFVNRLYYLFPREHQCDKCTCIQDNH